MTGHVAIGPLGRRVAAAAVSATLLMTSTSASWAVSRVTLTPDSLIVLPAGVDSLETAMLRNRYARELTRYLFVPVVAADSTDALSPHPVKSESPFLPLVDHQRLSLSTESVALMPWNLVGYRFALFGSVSTSALGPDHASFLSSRYYVGVGAGFRLHHSRLVFPALEVSFAYSPSEPPDASTTTLDLRRVQGLQSDLFEAGRPEPVPFD